MTRVNSGWVPSPIGEPQSVGWDAEAPQDTRFEDEPDMTDELVQQSECIPLGNQDEVDQQASLWGGEWAVNNALPLLPWPADSCEQALPQISVLMIRQAAATFPANTALGWDKLHPRAIARCSDAALEALARIFMLAEALGRWPSQIGIVLICLLPKPDGGRRPIGLLPSLIRLWMRIRVTVVGRWQAQHSREYFYAGPRRGVQVAAWKQAARAELAQACERGTYAAMLLDLVEAFERVPHDWLVRQGSRYNYPLKILRLSIAAYRLGRTIVIDGICSVLLWATRGITAGSVFATIELRVLLIQWLDESAAAYSIVTFTVYVDDTSIEATGQAADVAFAVAGATTRFTRSLRMIGMEFSPTKNACLASSTKLARRVINSVPGICVSAQQRAKSLGGALGAGCRRNTQVQQRRLSAFKVRQLQFQKLRRIAGARRSHLVLRTGGAAAMVYGQANTGVSDSVLLAQRRAVAAASVAFGAGDLDLTLVLADGSAHGKADPAFAAHLDPIDLWAEAVWCGWLSRTDLQTLAGHAMQRVLGQKSPWGRVTGPAAAFVASARRLGRIV